MTDSTAIVIIVGTIIGIAIIITLMAMGRWEVATMLCFMLWTLTKMDGYKDIFSDWENDHE